ncbi:hypothetical protein ACEN9F_14050 [Duganella sp. CT11-25]|uniref:hypothetical protein n=1 Tax=unclassified Duganella TaxID=2636909 RepID=UPI0039AF0A03
MKQRRKAVNINEHRPWPSHQYLSHGGCICSGRHFERIAYFSLADAAKRKACAILGFGPIGHYDRQHIMVFRWRLFI